MQRLGEAEELRVPLDMPLNTPGSHVYILDSLSDSQGNVHVLTASQLPRKSEQADAVAKLSNENSRSLSVLRRAAMSFKDCGPGNPASLLIGSDATLDISARDSDAQDGPWDVTIEYKPSQGAQADGKAAKPWKKKLTTPTGRTSLTVNAGAPGEYTILDVRGRYCMGDVLSPETCKVVEQPYPTADIEWKRIHEW